MYDGGDKGLVAHHVEGDILVRLLLLLRLLCAMLCLTPPLQEYLVLRGGNITNRGCDDRCGEGEGEASEVDLKFIRYRSL